MSIIFESQRLKVPTKIQKLVVKENQQRKKKWWRSAKNSKSKYKRLKNKISHLRLPSVKSLISFDFTIMCHLPIQ